MAVVVDDLDMQVTHILRGHDWLPSTPIHLLVFKYLGGTMPEIGHLTDILSSQTGKKLSKRRDSVFVEDFIKMGYLPQALLNFVMLLGWAPKDNRELFTLGEFVKHFDINGFQSANPRFFENKLDWLNGEYVRNLDDKEFVALAGGFVPKTINESLLLKLAPLLKTRVKKLSELPAMLVFFTTSPEVDKSFFRENWQEQVKDALEAIVDLKDWNLEDLNNKLMQKVNEKNYKTGIFFMNLRVGVTGQTITPPINESMIILGKEEVVKRLNKVLM